MNANVRLPNSAIATTPLGVGLATLMREPSPARQQRLLAAAFEAGFRHFDVAPSYGLGTAEAALGRFLRTRPAGVTVATKVGILSRGNAGLLRSVQRPARALLRRFPALRGRATQAVGAAVHTAPDFSPETMNRSLEASRRALGVECVDVLLLHEPQLADLLDGRVLEWLGYQKRRGLVQNVGIATSSEAAIAFAARHDAAIEVLQYPHSILDDGGARFQLARGLCVTHSVLARPLAKASDRARIDSRWAQELSERAAIDAAAPGELARLLLACALQENHGGIVVVGSSSEEHLRAAARAVGGFDAARLASAVIFLKSTLG